RQAQDVGCARAPGGRRRRGGGERPSARGLLRARDLAHDRATAVRGDVEHGTVPRRGQRGRRRCRCPGGGDPPRDHTRAAAGQSRLPRGAEEGRLHHARRARGRAQEVRSPQGAQAAAVFQALRVARSGALRDRSRSRRVPRMEAPVAVLGATGYVGVELLRLLSGHPAVELVVLSADQHRGRRASDVHPFLAGIVDLPLVAADPAVAAQAEIVLSALPHGASAPVVREILARGRRVIDLSADFRLRDPAVYARWYTTHPAPELLAEAVYGLPEFYRRELRQARLVACPGCYPTGALLGLVPLARAGLLDDSVVIDAKSGTTG